MSEKPAISRKRYSSRDFKREYLPLLKEIEIEMNGSGADLRNTLLNAASGIISNDLLRDPIFRHADLWREVRNSKLLCLMRLADREGRPEAYKIILHWMLSRLDVAPPKGVIVPFQKDAGAPKKATAEKTRERYEELGRPPLTAKTFDELAKFSYPREFAKAKPGSKNRKRLRDRVGRQVRLALAKPAAASAT